MSIFNYIDPDYLSIPIKNNLLMDDKIVYEGVERTCREECISYMHRDVILKQKILPKKSGKMFLNGEPYANKLELTFKFFSDRLFEDGVLKPEKFNKFIRKFIRIPSKLLNRKKNIKFDIETIRNDNNIFLKVSTKNLRAVFTPFRLSFLLGIIRQSIQIYCSDEESVKIGKFYKSLSKIKKIESYKEIINLLRNFYYVYNEGKYYPINENTCNNLNLITRNPKKFFGEVDDPDAWLSRVGKDYYNKTFTTDMTHGFESRLEMVEESHIDKEKNIFKFDKYCDFSFEKDKPEESRNNE